jgi:hypothetical protein
MNKDLFILIFPVRRLDLQTVARFVNFVSRNLWYVLRDHMCLISERHFTAPGNSRVVACLRIGFSTTFFLRR